MRTAEFGVANFFVAASGSPLGRPCSCFAGSLCCRTFVPRNSVATPGVRRAGAGPAEGVGVDSPGALLGGAGAAFSFIKLPRPRPNPDFENESFSRRKDTQTVPEG